MKAWLFSLIVAIILISGCVGQTAAPPEELPVPSVEKPEEVVMPPEEAAPPEEAPSELSYKFIGDFSLDKKFVPQDAKSNYKVSFVVVRPTNAQNNVFSEATMKEIVTEMNDFWSEMSHGKTVLTYDKKYDVDFPGEITCLKISGCPDSWPDHNILGPKFEELNIDSDVIVVFVDADVTGWEAAASRSFEQYQKGSWPSTIYNYRPWSVVLAGPEQFEKPAAENARTLSHEFFHTIKFINAEDAYVGAAKLKQGLPAEYYSATGDLMGDGQQTSYLAGYKRAELGWEKYSDVNAQKEWMTVDLKPNCMDGNTYRIPLGIASKPPIEWFEANSQNDIFYHSIFLEWVGSTSCAWDTSAEGLRATEVYEIYDYNTKRLHSVYERDLVTALKDFNSYKISIDIISKTSTDMKVRVTTGLEKENFTSAVGGQVYSWTGECFEGSPAEGTAVHAAGLSYTAANGLSPILQSNKDASFTQTLFINPEYYNETEYSTWVRGVWPTEKWVVDSMERSICPDPPRVPETARGDWFGTFEEFERCDFSIILVDSLGNYYSLDYKTAVPVCT